MPLPPKLLQHSISDIVAFTRLFGGLRLRTYQQAVARAILRSVLGGLGHAIVVMFPRQSGKNELQARLEAYLMFLLSKQGAEMVKISPTYQPQCLNAMRRLEGALDGCLLTRGKWQRQAGNLYRYQNACLTFLSGAPGSNIVGATASTLLQVDEAQDVLISKYEREIAPMAASTNATRVFWGTAWTSQTLLARELRLAEADQMRDGVQRVFRLTADEVAAEVPAYGAYVSGQVARMGRQHPMIRTQYFSEEIDGEGGLFTAERLALMRGTHLPQNTPTPGQLYVLLIDLAGEDESARDAQIQGLQNPARDAVAVTVVQVDLSLMEDALIRKPVYRVVKRYLWVGERHAQVYARVRALAEAWGAVRLVVDASGVGAGLASFLRDSLGGRVLSVTFNAGVKSRIGWGFLSVVDSGRFKEHGGEEKTTEYDRELQALFFKQLAGTQYTVVPGPEKHLRWGVPQGARDPQTGELLHDDLVLSAAFVSLLDEEKWGTGGSGVILAPADPLKEIEGGF